MHQIIVYFFGKVFQPHWQGIMYWNTVNVPRADEHISVDKWIKGINYSNPRTYSQQH